jgi:hypothetical protein
MREHGPRSRKENGSVIAATGGAAQNYHQPAQTVARVIHLPRSPSLHGPVPAKSITILWRGPFTTLEHSKQRNHVMRNLLVPSAALLVATVGVALAAEELKSGLQVGDKTEFFNVRDITGPAKGQTLCYR